MLHRTNQNQSITGKTMAPQLYVGAKCNRNNGILLPINRVFLILSASAGFFELAGGLKTITNDEKF